MDENEKRMMLCVDRGKKTVDGEPTDESIVRINVVSKYGEVIVSNDDVV
jgi:hypothetical protein